MLHFMGHGYGTKVTYLVIHAIEKSSCEY